VEREDIHRISLPCDGATSALDKQANEIGDCPTDLGISVAIVVSSMQVFPRATRSAVSITTC
jgi:hypothetical protein